MIAIEIHSKGNWSEEEVRQFADRKMHFALDRLRVPRRLVISIADVNGPKGGNDKLCRITAEFGRASVHIEETQPTWESAVTRAIRRLARRAARELRRINRSSIGFKRCRTGATAGSRKRNCSGKE